MRDIKKRLRLSVFRSNKYIYAQIIDDEKQVTLASANSLQLTTNSKRSKIKEAEELGQQIAERALKKGVKKVRFDRGRYKYHGRIKALAEGARTAGLDF